MSPEQIIDKINASVTNLYLKEDFMSSAEMLIARQLKASGMATAQIAAKCGLSEQEVQSL